jgi:hypothetical protein
LYEDILVGAVTVEVEFVEFVETGASIELVDDPADFVLPPPALLLPFPLLQPNRLNKFNRLNESLG